jgi:hypothetical protein
MALIEVRRKNSKEIKMKMKLRDPQAVVQEAMRKAEVRLLSAQQPHSHSAEYEQSYVWLFSNSHARMHSLLSNIRVPG